MSSQPISVPGSSPSTPLDPSKLNQTPVTLPSEPRSSNANTQTLRSPEQEPSAYLDGASGHGSEQASHPTIAETGLATSLPDDGSGMSGPGPKSGQLKRVPGGEKPEQEVISLGSFGGDGLKAKPPPPVGVQPKSPEIATFDVVG
ncbi:hypothetical protein BD324DRAFT_624238 [Kockovaella imperatae]|uniref:Uncharacterized protein n=1 Tax=Kockovaella imperatae TaxID=4999 RepID=A0A1Y1UKJ6_9TREE|nr:hypothetical protein BD324DRAFT_624238 [Kockovaella imperatae]ORX38024.1 hypothetical protein BD324DRAFT_624238 [Kockovaella imperatae]